MVVNMKRLFLSTPVTGLTTPESSACAYIRRESLDIYNRLHSIQADIAFVNEVRAAYPSLPLICIAYSTVHSILPLLLSDKSHGQQTCAAGFGTLTLPSYISLLHYDLHALSDGVTCRRILWCTRTSKVPTVITETGPSTSAARIYIYCSSLPPMAYT